MKNDVSDYDLFDYDYTTYWKNRSYENLAEKNILNKVLSEKQGHWFLDIGGSYGRLASTYYNQYNHSVILDYSLKTLQRNKETILSKYPNMTLIAANAYKMPFREDSFDGALMVRVLHHIENTSDYFKELFRVMNSKSLYIQEFANKIHLKASIKALFKLDFNFFSTEPYEHPLTENTEGTSQGLKGIFYNYHPSYIREQLIKNNFIVKKKYGCSFLRIPFLKRIFNEDIMIFLEKILQLTLSWTNIPPSIFFTNEVIKEKKSNNEDFTKIEDILVCPSCKSRLDFPSSDLAVCKKCSKQYKKENDIWDFRII